MVALVCKAASEPVAIVAILNKTRESERILRETNSNIVTVDIIMPDVNLIRDRTNVEQETNIMQFL